jgi:predicted nucleic acid-binding protein
MRGVRAFLDTNAVTYLFSEDEPAKRQHSIDAVNTYDCQISTQVLNEFCNICIRKWNLRAGDIYRAIGKICAYSRLWVEVVPIVKTKIVAF